MIGAGVEVLAQAGGHVRRAAVHGQRVDQRIAAGTAQVIVAPAEPAQVARVIDQAQVHLDAGPAQRPGAGRIDVEHHLLLRCQQRLRAEQLPGLPGVLGRYQVREGARGLLAGQPEHLGAKRGQDERSRRNAIGAEILHVGGDGVVRALILLGRLRVPGADPEHEPARVLRLQAGEGTGHGVRVVLPDVDDAGADQHRRRRGEQLADLGQLAVGRSADPQRAEARFLQVGRELAAHLGAGPPDTELSEPVTQVGCHASIRSACRRRPAATPACPRAGTHRRRGARARAAGRS